MDDNFLKKASETILQRNVIDKELYTKFDVKRGLRNADGSGVLAGLTQISSVVGFKKEGDKIIPVDGELYYRGIHIRDIVKGLQAEKRHGFSEVSYLLLFGKLPTRQELEEFEAHLKQQMHLPKLFVENSILQFISPNVMNALQRDVLTLYTLDDNPDDISIPNVVRQCLNIIAKFPSIIAYSYNALLYEFGNKQLIIRAPRDDYDIAENFLYMLRPSGEFSQLEAELLDLALVLHAEHGGGNNSAFTMHVVTSSHTDTYSAVAAAIGSLKGPLHGAANSYVRDMIKDFMKNVKHWDNEKEVADYIEKIIRKEAFDRKGLIYGMGHAVYTKSDPRAIILKEKARELAEEKGRLDEFHLYDTIERLTPEIFRRVKQSDKVISANVDFYSGFVYDMLGFPQEIFTAIFAMARIVGWSAHRIEELINGGRIIRPAYKGVAAKQDYIPLDRRN
ncbi:MAG: citrate/2-methylcitrate synthase [Calditrichaeota bacterium]|nr:citrate/2-methylcitrate synthase [Calditrichota bacterium]